MTEKDLKSIKILKIEIDRTKQVLCGLKNSNTSQKSAYAELLSQYEAELYGKKIQIEQEIQHIEDAEIRLILKLKFIDMRSWNYVARTMHYDRTTVYKKYKKFINKEQARNEKVKSVSGV